MRSMADEIAIEGLREIMRFELETPVPRLEWLQARVAAAIACLERRSTPDECIMCGRPLAAHDLRQLRECRWEKDRRLQRSLARVDAEAERRRLELELIR